MTISIAAHDPLSGMIGVAISSSSICVAARCAWARAGVGVVLTQNVTNPRLGSLGLDLMAQGLSAPTALNALLQVEGYPAYRQLLVLDRQGNKARHTGEKALGLYASAEGEDCIAAGNLLANEGVPQAMVRAFDASEGHLAARLLAALQGGLEAGGEAGPLYSAGLLVVHQQPWPLVDLRVDWDEASQPIRNLQSLWLRYQPQMQDYVTRALNPVAAPKYGVPGDE